MSTPSSLKKRFCFVLFLLVCVIRVAEWRIHPHDGEWVIPIHEHNRGFG